MRARVLVSKFKSRRLVAPSISLNRLRKVLSGSNEKQQVRHWIDFAFNRDEHWREARYESLFPFSL